MPVVITTVTFLQISFFLGDYSSALSRATSFDSQIYGDASEVSTTYAAVVALSIRQAFAATEITISKTSSGSWDTNDILIFLKGTCFLHLLVTVNVSVRNIKQWCRCLTSRKNSMLTRHRTSIQWMSSSRPGLYSYTPTLHLEAISSCHSFNTRPLVNIQINGVYMTWVRTESRRMLDPLADRI
jgi:hypothetical protein